MNKSSLRRAFAVAFAVAVAMVAAPPQEVAAQCGFEWTLGAASGPGGYEIAYDESRNVTVMFTGDRKTWEWDGSTWTDRGTGGPPSRGAAALVYDPVGQRCLLFGGYSDQGARKDLWSWNGSTWTELSAGPTDASGRGDFAMCFDRDRNRLVIHGGWPGGGSMQTDTLEWNPTNNTWARWATGPIGPRYAHRMAYDEVRNECVLHGGYYFTNKNDTWRWNGSTWTAAGTTGPARYVFGMAFDSTRGQLVLHGGTTCCGEVEYPHSYIWNGTSWTLCSLQGPARGYMNLAYDRVRDTFVMPGGMGPTATGRNYIPETWELAMSSDPDTDGDGIVDSADNCPAIANPSQADCDSDGTGDVCEIASGSPDIDSNGRPDECQTITLVAGASIQAAIDSAPTDEMRIISCSAGTFYGPLAFGGKPIVLRGAGAALTLIFGTGGASTSVVRLFHEPAIATIEHLTIRGGETGSVHPDNAKANVGGGVFGYYTAASIRDCVIDDNGAGFGGGVYLYYSTGDIERCVFTGNYAGVSGGGLMSLGGSLDVRDSELIGNTCNDGNGGGVCLVYGQRSLVGTEIRDNASAHGSGGGVLWAPADDAAAFLAIQGCSISDNVASTTCGGVRIVETDRTANASIAGTDICGNTPAPNVEGLWTDLGDNSVCDCLSDINLDGTTDGIDLAIVLQGWGTCTGGCTADLDGDGVVGGTDLAALFSGWGSCN